MRKKTTTETPQIEMENLVEDPDEEYQRRVVLAKETCRQRRMATYFMLGVYVVLAVYLFKFRRPKDL